MFIKTRSAGLNLTARLVTLGTAILPLSASALTSGPQVSSPKDPFFPNQWSLSNSGAQTVNIDIDNLHSVRQKGVAGVDIGWLDARTTLAQAKGEVIVAVIDSGLDMKHPELKGRIAEGAHDFLAGSDEMTDEIGHGTHVAGIIAANADNGVGIAGIAPATVKVLPLKVLSEDYENFTYNGKLISDYVAEAVNYAVAHHANVINMSLGWPKLVDTDNARKAVQDAVKAGVLVVVAAGNDRKDEPTYPCAYEGVLCVGSITNTGGMAVYSNSGGLVDILAPGDGILSLYPMETESQVLRIQGFENLSGTSQASPHIAGIAAAVKSVYPAISLPELKARLLISANPVPAASAALYGLANLKTALDAKPTPVFLPSFKNVVEATVAEGQLTLGGELAVENLWDTATSVKADVLVNGKQVGSATLPKLGLGEKITIPWKHVFQSLDESSDLPLTVRVTRAPGVTREFTVRASAARDISKIQQQDVIEVPSLAGGPNGAKTADWIALANRHYFSLLTSVDSYPAAPGMPMYYQQAGGNDKANITVMIFDPSASAVQDRIHWVTLNGIQRVTQVMRIDANEDGHPDWLVTGIGGLATGPATGGKDAKDKTGPYFQFQFMNDDFKPLWSGTSAANSVWRLTLDEDFVQLVLRNYALPNSWIRSDDRLLPAFLAQGPLPEADNFDALDKRHYKSEDHLYYLAPKAKQSGTEVVELEVRALDGSKFRTARGSSFSIQGAIPQSSEDRKAGRLRLLTMDGEGISASINFWDIRSITNQYFTPARGWTAVSANGKAVPVNPGDDSAFLNFFDEKRGAISWTSSRGTLEGRSEFSFSSIENPITGLIGAFKLPSAGRVWFLESNFDLVAFQQAGEGAAIQSQAMPIERDSSFLGEQFSEMLSPVLVGTAGQPLPGVYIDSTLVRGNRVSVAVWNPRSSKLEKPLRYSLQIPQGCVQMSPVKLSNEVGSFALPVLCKKTSAMEFRLVRPASSL